MTFGNAGKIIPDLGEIFDAIQDMAIQPDGKIVVAAYFANDFAVARYNPDGTLDQTFDGDGIVTTKFRVNSFDRSMAIAVQPDGKIIAGGSSGNSSGPFNIDFALIRYNSNGSLDTTFGNNGKVITNIPWSQRILDLAIQPDGKILAAGYYNNDLAFARFLGDPISVFEKNTSINPTDRFIGGRPGIDLNGQYPSTGFWYILKSEDGSFISFPFGQSGDIPAPGDYDGNGIYDTSVFRPSTATWFSNTQTQSTVYTVFGANGDRPVPGSFVP